MRFSPIACRKPYPPIFGPVAYPAAYVPETHVRGPTVVFAGRHVVGGMHPIGIANHPVPADQRNFSTHLSVQLSGA